MWLSMFCIHISLGLSLCLLFAIFNFITALGIDSSSLLVALLFDCDQSARIRVNIPVAFLVLLVMICISPLTVTFCHVCQIGKQNMVTNTSSILFTKYVPG